MSSLFHLNLGGFLACGRKRRKRSGDRKFGGWLSAKFLYIKLWILLRIFTCKMERYVLRSMALESILRLAFDYQETETSESVEAWLCRFAHVCWHGFGILIEIQKSSAKFEMVRAKALMRRGVNGQHSPLKMVGHNRLVSAGKVLVNQKGNGGYITTGVMAKSLKGTKQDTLWKGNRTRLVGPKRSREDLFAA